jgi:hypothetical protein
MATTPKEMHSAVCNYKRENDKERKKRSFFSPIYLCVVQEKINKEIRDCAIPRATKSAVDTKRRRATRKHTCANNCGGGPENIITKNTHQRIDSCGECDVSTHFSSPNNRTGGTEIFYKKFLNVFLFFLEL